MTDIWLDGYERIPLGADVAGMTYEEPDDPKLLWHMTQGTSVDGAISAYRRYPPQLCVDPRARRKVQHIPLNLAGYSLAGTPNDRSRVVQVEVVGFSEDAHELPDDQLQWLADKVVVPVREAFGVPDVHLPFYAPHEVDFVLASPESPLRLTVAALRQFSGHLAHQHAPAPDEHWDAGGLRIARILELARPRNPQRKRKNMTNGIGIQVTSGPVRNIPVGFCAMIDFTNSRSTFVADAKGFQQCCKDAGVPHLGVNGAEAADWISKYNAGPAVQG